MKVLFVCLGNICRSPLAEGLFAHHLRTMALDNVISCDSCGTGNWHAGELADPRMRKTAEKNNITLTHRARQICHSDFEEFDHIFVMDHSNYDNVVKLRPELAHKVNLLTYFHDTYKNQIVPDPYFGGQEGFDEVFNILNIITKDLVHFLHQSA
ncbi:MAG: low molecular weight protein-tyrosine-phosphatase [Chitinophagaceae bacterium]